MSKENSNKSIREKLHSICNKIEQILKEYNESKEQDRYLKQTQDIYNINNGSKINIIKNLKQNVNLIQNNLEKIYDIGKINKLESEIKKKISILNQLSKEQSLLYNVVRKQQESIDDYSSKFTTNKEISDVRDKLKFAKEENHMNRETYKLLNAKIKGQLSKIDVLDKKSKIIKQNIEFQQRKRKKEVEKSMNGGENEDDEEENEGDPNDLDCLILTEKMLILEIDEEEKNFKNEINHQYEIINQINERINILNNKKSEIKQKMKQKDIQKKIELNKSKERNRNKRNKEKNINKNINNKSNDYQNKIYKTNKFLYKNGETPKNKNELINIYTNGKSNTKPFDIRKFNLNNNNISLSNGKIYSSMYNYNNEIRMSINENNNKYNNNIFPIKEIEQLQNEIKNALKNNVAILNTDNSNEKNINIYKSNNDNIIKIGQSSDLNNKKSKPFEKFNFN